MSDYVAALQAQHAHDTFMNAIYALTAVCIIYKMTYIAMLAERAPRMVRLAMKMSALFVGTIIAMKALGRFHNGDPAQWLDIAREMSWCGLLFTIGFYLNQISGRTK